MLADIDIVSICTDKIKTVRLLFYSVLFKVKVQFGIYFEVMVQACAHMPQLSHSKHAPSFKLS